MKCFSKTFVMRPMLPSLLWLIGLCVPCGAQLQPNEIAIIAARGNPESEGLAKYYARVRDVPSGNICLVDVPRGEVCPQEMWRWGIRPEINKWLTQNDPQQKIRCLVTVWGIPLKIAPAASDAHRLKYQQFLAAERTHRLGLLGQILKSFGSIAPDNGVGEASGSAGSAKSEARTGDAKGAPSEKPAAVSDDGAAVGGGNKPSSELSRLQLELETALQSAQARIAKVQGDERTRGQLQLQQLATAAGGLNVLLPALNQRLTSETDATPQMRSEFDTLRGRLGGFIEAKALFDQMPFGMEHDALVLAILERTGGLIATVDWLNQQLEVVKKNETGAAFDSELALVMWPDGYQLLRWQPNYLRPAFNNSQLPKFNRTLMVSRIDAPTLRLAKGLIDTAIEVEKKGLRGTVYIDSRGLAKTGQPNEQPGSFIDYDRSLLSAANFLKERTDLKVVVEETPQLFQPGQCKEAALYCGWYSLAKYIDAFDWVPGAVAYHLASSEAATLRDPGSEVWCKKLLEDGVCATIGPVYEPYLAAFPRPAEFFALLLRGDLSLVECYSNSNPMNSWMMTLVGDPLYRPFKYRTPARGDGAKPPTIPPPSQVLQQQTLVEP